MNLQVGTALCGIVCLVTARVLIDCDDNQIVQLAVLISAIALTVIACHSQTAVERIKENGDRPKLSALTEPFVSKICDREIKVKYSIRKDLQSIGAGVCALAGPITMTIFLARDTCVLYSGFNADRISAYVICSSSLFCGCVCTVAKVWKEHRIERIRREADWELGCVVNSVPPGIGNRAQIELLQNFCTQYIKAPDRNAFFPGGFFQYVEELVALSLRMVSGTTRSSIVEEGVSQA